MGRKPSAGEAHGCTSDSTVDVRILSSKRLPVASQGDLARTIICAQYRILALCTWCKDSRRFKTPTVSSVYARPVNLSLSMVLIPWRRKRSQPKPAQQQAGVDVESWGDRDAKVEVTQPKGFFTKVRYL